MGGSSFSSALSLGIQMGHRAMWAAHAPLTSNSPFSYHMRSYKPQWDQKMSGVCNCGVGTKLFSRGNHLGKSEGTYLQSLRRKGELT